MSRKAKFNFVTVNWKIIDTNCNPKIYFIYKIEEEMKQNNVVENACKVISETINKFWRNLLDLVKNNDWINGTTPSHIDWKQHCGVYIDNEYITDIFVYKDGDRYFVHWYSFVNLQESTYWYWKTKQEAIEYYIMKRIKQQHLVIKEYE